jgi:methyltransferase (TIGR00027 family)
MIERRPSKTAWRVATRRAAHQTLDAPPVFPDPLSLHIVSNQTGPETSTELRLFLAVRSCYAEDELAAAVARGVMQYVLLCVGLDTFAYRNPYPHLKVFEVDHPATQAWKRERLAETGIAIPDSLQFAPVDFETETLAHGLAAAGFRADRPAFFSWLGVLPYLTREAFDSTVRFIASLPEGSTVVFDYCIPLTSMRLLERMALDVLSARVAAAGEPFLLFFDPAELAGVLEALGFHDREDLGCENINARYRLHWRGPGRLIRARRPAEEQDNGKLASFCKTGSGSTPASHDPHPEARTNVQPYETKNDTNKLALFCKNRLDPASVESEVPE